MDFLDRLYYKELSSNMSLSVSGAPVEFQYVSNAFNAKDY
jgi:hypothetical protein